MNGAKMTGEAPTIWARVFFLIVAGLYQSKSMFRIYKYAVAAMPITVLLFLVPI
jgi:hypothetical protein